MTRKAQSLIKVYARRPQSPLVTRINWYCR